jgi:hypothetical protein
VDEAKKADSKKLLDILNSVVLNDGGVSFEALEALAIAASAIAPSLDRSDIDDVIARVTEMRRVTLDLGDGVVDSASFTKWIDDRRTQVDLVRWNAYSNLLLQREWSPNVVARLDEQTDSIVELMGDPTVSGEWARRGLVIGEVQSGKTATYAGVLDKALDYGYKVVVVIGGHTEDLRRQTQQRVDTDVTGVDTSFILENVVKDAQGQRVGVGLNTEFSTHTLTTTHSDFSASSKRASFVALGGDTPTVFVVKKNVRVLNNLTAYLTAQNGGRLTAPMVVIDDEADWASINTKSEEEAAAVNRGIRNLLNASRRSSYLAITATPFANILIDDAAEGDLFPRDYIQALRSPNNYSGVNEYFGEDERAEHRGAIRTDVEDCLEVLPFNHKKTAQLDDLPESLLDALAAFHIGVAVRRLRGQAESPASMMVNISRFNDVQAQVSDLISDAVRGIQLAIESEFGLDEGVSLPGPVTSRLARVHQEEFAGDADWIDVKAELLKLAGSFQVDLVNSGTMKKRAKRMSELSREERRSDSLLPRIFVGGDVLARGLTLDGLQVSYFVRRAAAADTLLQMGRWFGYRPGYGDLVRVWIDSDVVDLFRYVSEVSEELRSSLRQMNARNMTPLQFGIRMQRHPESFLITAANKQKHGTTVYDINIHGSKFESWKLPATHADRERNLDAARSLAQSLIDLGPQDESRGMDLIWTEVPVALVSSFFSAFAGHESETFFGPGVYGGGNAQIRAHLGDARNADLWDVGFVSGNGDEVDLAGGLRFKSSVRNRIRPEGSSLSLGNRRVAAGEDLKKALQREGLKDLVVEALVEQQLGPEGKPKLSEPVLIRRLVDRPLLLVFALTTKKAIEDVGEPSSGSEYPKIDISATDPLIAALVAFPSIDLEDEVATDPTRKRVASFIANGVYARANLGLPETEDDVETEDYE